MAFTVSIDITAQIHRVEIFYIQFHPNQARYMEGTHRNSFIPLCNIHCHLANFHRTNVRLTTFCRILKGSYTEFHENLPNGLATDSKSHKNWWIWSSYDAFLFTSLRMLKHDNCK
jgi:hypothetical protein